MSYDQHAHAKNVRGWCMRLLADGGPGWFDFVQAKADALVKQDPTLHGTLAKDVAAFISDAKAKARQRQGAPA